MTSRLRRLRRVVVRMVNTLSVSGIMAEDTKFTMRGPVAQMVKRNARVLQPIFFHVFLP